MWQVPHHPAAPLYLIRTNSVGARSVREPGAETPAARVMVLGCSLATGDGVSNQDRFSEHLERELPGVEAHNYALSGSAHDQQMLIHREFHDRVKPDVLVLAGSIGCIGRNLLHARLHRDTMTGGSILVPKPYFTLEHDALVEHHIPVPKPSPQAHADARFDVARAAPRFGGARRIVRTLLRRNVSAHLHPAYDDASKEVYRLGFALLASTIRESRARLKLLAPLPDFAYATRRDATNHHAFYASLAAQTGATFVDVATFFAGLSDAQARTCFFQHDGHYTPEGHAVIARGLAGVLRRHGLVR